MSTYYNVRVRHLTRKNGLGYDDQHLLDDYEVSGYYLLGHMKDFGYDPVTEEGICGDVSDTKNESAELIIEKHKLLASKINASINTFAMGDFEIRALRMLEALAHFVIESQKLALKMELPVRYTIMWG